MCRPIRALAPLALGLSCATWTPKPVGAGDVYALPFLAEELGADEWIAAGVHAGGIQAAGKDFGIRRWAGGRGWSGIRPGTSGAENADSVSYGRPFHAVADGEVIGCWRNAPENPAPGKHNSGLTGGLIGGGGNALWIRQDDGAIALYAHAIPGSIPAELCPYQGTFFDEVDHGADVGQPDVHPNVFVPPDVSPDTPTGGDVRRPRVRRGQFLGRVGNSGSSSAPHLHLHMEAPTGRHTALPHPMRFGDVAWIPVENGGADRARASGGDGRGPPARAGARERVGELGGR
jgi:hypothetical protein